MEKTASLQPIFYPLHHQCKFSWALFPVSFAAKSDLATQFWPMGHDQKCVQIISAALMLTPSSFPSWEKNANMAGHPPLTVQGDWRVVWWKDLGSVSWDNTAAGPDGPEGLSQTTLDPNISNMKGSVSKRGPSYGTPCKVIYRHWHGEMSEACNDF